MDRSSNRQTIIQNASAKQVSLSSLLVNAPFNRAKSRFRRGSCSSKQGALQSGAAIAEFVVVLPMLLLIALGCIQWAFIYQAKVTVDHATFMAARSGAVSGADVGTMRSAFANGILPLYSPEVGVLPSFDVGKGLEAWQDSQHWAGGALGFGATQMLILNPTREAFTDFGMNIGSNTVIPNDRLHLKSQQIVGASEISIQDANLLKLQVVYGYKLEIPFLREVMQWIGARLTRDLAKQSMWLDGRIPLMSTTTVRMQSNPILSDAVLDMDDVEALLEDGPAPFVDPTSYDGNRPWDIGPYN